MKEVLYCVTATSLKTGEREKMYHKPCSKGQAEIDRITYKFLSNDTHRNFRVAKYSCGMIEAKYNEECASSNEKRINMRDIHKVLVKLLRRYLK